MVQRPKILVFNSHFVLNKKNSPGTYWSPLVTQYLQATYLSSLDRVLDKTQPGTGRGVSQTAIRPIEAIWTSWELNAYSICCQQLSVPGVAEVADLCTRSLLLT